jgi:hypothetical protein
MVAAIKKSRYRIDVGTNKCIYLKAKASVIAGVISEIGWVLDDDGIPPAGKTIVADNRAEAMDQGLVPFRITYLKNRKSQSTILLAAPDKADTAKDDLLGQTYNGGKIYKVGAPRRVKYVA